MHQLYFNYQLYIYTYTYIQYIIYIYVWWWDSQAINGLVILEAHYGGVSGDAPEIAGTPDGNTGTVSEFRWQLQVGFTTQSI